MNAHAEHWMAQAIAQVRAGIAAGQSPFGAVIVRGGIVIARGHNQVWQRTDPTAHAEVVCIQNAARTLATIDLSGCEMYTTTEPCPMCAAAIHWSKLDAVYYGATIADAMNAGFTELSLSIHDVFKRGGSSVRAVGGVLSRECAALFDEWKQAGGKAY